MPFNPDILWMIMVILVNFFLVLIIVMNIILSIYTIATVKLNVHIYGYSFIY